MNWEGKVKDVSVIQTDPLCNAVYEVELESGETFEFPLDNTVKKGHRYKFYRNLIFWGLNSLEEIKSRKSKRR